MFYLLDKPIAAVAYDVVAQSDGTVALRRPDGKFMELDAFGNWQVRDDASGGDSRFKRGKTGGLVAEGRGGDNKTFVLEGVEA